MTESADTPAVSVVIATYNWSAALRCAIRSALLQTLREIEIIAVGDGCTDDSAAVVASFADARVRWINLARNGGHQWRPNNEGISQTRAPFIAYLGHDDIWHPSHLESCMRLARERNADLVAGTTLLYGPPGSGIRGLTGLFRTGCWGPTEWAPPSSLLHRKSLVNRVGPWRDPTTLTLPSDVDFVKRLLAAGARTACTNELTVFKFNAGRRDTYKSKTNTEQQAMLARIEAGTDVQHRELIDFVRAQLAGEAFLPQMPPDAPAAGPGAVHQWNQTLKGTRARFGRDELRQLTSRERFPVPDDSGWMEWHLEEHDPRFGAFRWSGPQRRATIDVPLLATRPFTVRVHIIASIPGALTPGLSLNGKELSVTLQRTQHGTHLVTAQVPRQLLSEDPISITIEAVDTARPCDLGINADTRRLGVAVNWIEFEPA